MSNDNNKHLSIYEKLNEALKRLVDAMIVRDSGSWSPNSDAQEIVGVQVGVAWEKVYNHLREIERAAEARGRAEAVERSSSQKPNRGA